MIKSVLILMSTLAIELGGFIKEMIFFAESN